MQLLLPKWQRIVGQIYLSFVGSISLLLGAESLYCWAFHGLCLFALFVLRETLKYYRRKSFKESFLKFLDLVVLQMQAGRSFRDSMRVAMNSQCEFFRFRMDEIVQVVVFSQQAPRYSETFIRNIADELQKIDRTPHAALARLENYRAKLKILESFRRKSGQILLQSRIQCTVMCAMYFALLLFMGISSGFTRYIGLLFVSVSLFGTGTAWAFCIGRKLSWKL